MKLGMTRLLTTSMLSLAVALLHSIGSAADGSTTAKPATDNPVHDLVVYGDAHGG